MTETPDQRKRRLAREIAALTMVGSDCGYCIGCDRYSVNARRRAKGSEVVCEACNVRPVDSRPLADTGQRGGA